MRALLVSLLVLSVLGLALRWGCVDHSVARKFSPHPDAQEYAALAHGIADRGEFAFELGDHHHLPARYPPGWPALLAIAIRCGLRGEALVWIGGAIATLHGLLLAWIAWWTWCRVLDPLGRRPGLGLLAAWVAGIGWMLCPFSIRHARFLMADEAGALFAGLGLVAVGIGLAGARRQWLGLAIGGGALAVSIAIRPTTMVLEFGPVVCLLLHAALRFGIREAGLRLVAVLFGAGLVVVGVGWVASSGGRSFWQWMPDYGFWSPFFRDFWTEVVNPRFAFRGNPVYPYGGMGHLEVGLRTLVVGAVPTADSGVDGGVEPIHTLGLFWPALAWVGWFFLARGQWRRGGLILLAFGGWVVGHLVVYSLYYFPDPRFYVAPMATTWVLTGLLAARALAVGVPRWILLAGAGVVAVPVTVGVLPQLGWDPGGPDPDNAVTAARFASWLQTEPQERAGRVLPFDPLQVQALGLLTSAAAARIDHWGRIPANVGQRAMLERLGVIPDLRESIPPVRCPDGRTLRMPHGAEASARGRGFLEPRSGSYVFTGTDAKGKPVESFHVPAAALARGRVEVTTGGGQRVFDAEFGSDAIPHRWNRYHQTLVLGGEGAKAYLRWTGRSLEIQLPAGVVGKAVAPGASPRAFRVPGFGEEPVFRSGEGSWFSHLHSDLVGGSVHYLTFAGDVALCLPVVDRTPSPFRVAASQPRVVAPTAERAEELRREGLGALVAARGGEPAQRVDLAEAWGRMEPRIGRALRLRAPTGDPAGATELVWPEPGWRLLRPRFAALEGARLRDGEGFPVERARALVFGRALEFTADAPLRFLRRNDHLLAGLAAAMAAGEIVGVEYHGEDGWRGPIGPVLAGASSGVDPTAPRLTLRFAAGLSLRCNLGTTGWRVAWGDSHLVLPPGGFAATAPTGLRAIYATTTAGQTFEFADEPGRGRSLQAFAEAVAFDGLSAAAGQFVFAPEDLSAAADLRIEPVAGGPRLSPGSSDRALRATVAVGGRRVDVTRRVRWSSGEPDRIAVGAMGVASARALGPAAIRVRGLGLAAELGLEAVSQPELPAPEFDPMWPGGSVDVGVSGTCGLRVQRILVFVRRDDVAEWATYPVDPRPSGFRFRVRVANLMPGRRYWMRVMAELPSGHQIDHPPQTFVAPL